MPLKHIYLFLITIVLTPSLGAQTVVGTLTHAGMQPYSVAVYEGGNKVFVADQTDGNVYMYDGTTLEELNSAYVGSWTYSMLVHEPTGKLYVAPMNHASIAVVNANTGDFIKYIDYPEGVDFNYPSLDQDPGLGKIYVSGYLQIDVATDEVKIIPASGGGCQGVNPVTHELYSSAFGVEVDRLAVTNGSTLQTTTYQGLGARCGNVGINTQENKAYIAIGGGGGVPFIILDRDNDSIAEVYADNDALIWAYNPTSNRIYTDSEVNANSTIIEGASNSFFNLPMPSATGAIAVRNSTSHVYYAGMDFIGVLDDSTQTLEMIPVANPSPSGILVQQIAVNQTTGRVFIINDGETLNFVTVVQDDARMTRPPVYVGYNDNTNYNIAVLETVGGRVSTFDPQPPCGGMASVGEGGLALQPGGGRLYAVTAFISGKFGVMAGAMGTLSDYWAWSLPCLTTSGVRPQTVAVAPDGGRVYWTDSSSNHVEIFETASQTISTTTIPVGAKPWGLAVTPDGTKIYVANRTDGTVSVLSTGSNTVTKTITVGTAPWGVAVNPGGSKAYVANSGSNSVSVIDTATDTVSATVFVGANPHWLAFSPGGDRVYVTNQGAGTVSVIGTGTDTVVHTVTVGGKPEGVAAYPDGSKVYVVISNASAASSLAVINPADYSVTSVSLNAESSNAFPIAIPDPESKFAGRVTNPHGGVSNALVRALQGGIEKGTATTNAAGDYSIFNLIPGTYTVEITGPGCTPLTLTGKTVGAGRTNLLNPELTHGECPSPAVEFSPAGVWFENRQLAITTSPTSVSLTNVGAVDLTITSIAKSGSQAGDFSFSHNCPLSPGKIAANGFCNINVTFTPSAPGPRKAALRVASDAPGSPHRILLSGVGAAIGVAPTGLTFASQKAGTTSAPQAVTVHNYGSSPVAVWSSAVSGANKTEFGRASSCPVPPTKLAAGGNCSIQVTFSPASAGTKTATLLISHDGGASPSSVSLTGTGSSSAMEYFFIPNQVTVNHAADGDNSSPTAEKANCKEADKKDCPTDQPR